MTALPNEKPYTIDDIEALPEGERAELLDGDMYMFATPSRVHQRISIRLTHLILDHIEKSGKPCDVYAAPFAVYLNGMDDRYNYVEPDISVICDPSKLNEKGCDGAPDWIIEIVSPSTEGYDYGRKLFKYRAAGVREYWIINPLRQSVTVYRFAADPDCTLYGFDDDIPVGISEGFTVRVSDLL